MVNLSTWLHTFLSALEETFPNRVWFVGLQGSYARGEATEASDIDIPEKLGSVMTDEDDNQLVTSEKKTQNSLQLQSTDGEIRITAYK